MGSTLLDFHLKLYCLANQHHPSIYFSICTVYITKHIKNEKKMKLSDIHVYASSLRMYSFYRDPTATTSRAPEYPPFIK